MAPLPLPFKSSFLFHKCYLCLQLSKLRLHPLISYLFIYLLLWVFNDLHRVFLVAASGHYSLLQCMGLLLRWLLLLWSIDSRHTGFSTMQAQLLWHMGPAALLHMESSQTRNRTLVSCASRWTLPCHQGSPTNLIQGVLKLEFRNWWTFTGVNDICDIICTSRCWYSKHLFFISASFPFNQSW